MKIKQLIDRFRGKRKVSDIIDELNSRIEEEWGVNANIAIHIFQHRNGFDSGEARNIAQKIAEEFDNTTFEDENEGTHWVKAVNEGTLEITVYWNDDNEI